MADEFKSDRRRFLGTAAMTLAATQLGMSRSAASGPRQTRPADAPATKTGTKTSFGSLKQIDAGVLKVGYAEAGPATGPAVILLTAGPTTSTASSMSHPCWRPPATG